jgi:hypothetical protein
MFGMYTPACTIVTVHWTPPDGRRRHFTQCSLTDWHTNGTHIWDTRGNYVKVHRAPILQSGCFHCGSKHVCACMWVCACACVNEREIWEKEREREVSWFVCQTAWSLSWDNWQSSSDITGIQHRKRVSNWPSGLRRGSAAARLLELWVRIPPGSMDVCLLWVLCVVSLGQTNARSWWRQ